MTDKFDPQTHRFGMAFRDKEGRILYPTRMDEVTSRAIIEPFKPWPTYYDFFNSNIIRAPEHDLIPRNVVDELVVAVRKVIEEGVQETEGPYSQHKNNKCCHGKFGYEGCDQCTCEFLEQALAKAAGV